MKSEPAKGFKDYSGKEAEKREEMKRVISNAFEKYGFEPAETPVIEHESFVKGDNEEDEVISDIFKLKDKGKRKLALRYEFTFQLKRLMENKKLPYKRYQIGPVFRDEPVSSNRFRQFTQCDADTIGSTLKDEAELLAMSKELLEEFKIRPEILVGNRKIAEGTVKILFGLEEEEQIKYLMRYLDKIDKKSVSEIVSEIKRDRSKTRFFKKITISQLEKIFTPLVNTLKRHSLDSLKEYILGVLRNQGREKDYEGSLFERGYEEMKELFEISRSYGLDLGFAGNIVRGLSYYNGTVFELKSKGIKETIVAGGSFMFNDTQCTGISFGLDRLMAVAEVESQKEKFLVVSLNQDKEAIKIAQDLRKNGKIATLYFGKPSKALQYANSKEISRTLFVGAEEVKKKKFKLKNMKTGEEKPVTLQQIKKKNVLFSKKNSGK